MNAETMSTLTGKVQAFLFVEGGPIALRKLARLVGCGAEELTAALDQLSARLEGSGVSLVRTDREVALAVSPTHTEAIKESVEKEQGRDIGDAGLETIAIILYRGPSTRADIDYIRGVNTSTTLRTLLVRGLVMRENNPADGREYLYRPTTELLAHLGVSDARAIPNYDEIRTELTAFETKSERPPAEA